MGDLGTHPMSILPSTFLFDGYTHLRNDMLTPNGSIDRPQPERDEKRLRPTIEWMLAGLPWMCADALAGVVDRPIDAHARRSRRRNVDDRARRRRRPRRSSARARAPTRSRPCASTDHDFVIWGTRRAPWRDHVKIEGDEAYAARVLDAIKII